MTKHEAVKMIQGFIDKRECEASIENITTIAVREAFSISLDAIKLIQDGDTQCRGCFIAGNACGQCQKCKAAAFDWICSNSTAMDEWAILQTGHHDIMRAIMQQCRKANP